MRHPLDDYLRKFIRLGKEFVLLCKMIEKLREISGRRSAYKVHHIFTALFCWYPNNPEAENGVESEN